MTVTRYILGGARLSTTNTEPEERAQRKADHDFLEQEAELHLNTELTKTVHTLAEQIHARVVKPTTT